MGLPHRPGGAPKHLAFVISGALSRARRGKLAGRRLRRKCAQGERGQGAGENLPEVGTLLWMPRPAESRQASRSGELHPRGSRAWGVKFFPVLSHRLVATLLQENQPEPCKGIHAFQSNRLLTLEKALSSKMQTFCRTKKETHLLPQLKQGGPRI